MQLVKINNNFYQIYSKYLFYLLMFCIPLKLSVSYGLYFILFLSCFAFNLSKDRLQSFYKQNSYLISIWFCFLIILFLSVPFGISIQNSFVELLKLSFYSLAIFVFYDLCSRFNTFKAVICLLIGQAIAAAHSILEYLYPEEIKRIFIGTLTESGQIGLTLILGLSIIAFLSKNFKTNFKKTTPIFLLVIIIFFALILNLKRGPFLGIFFAGLFYLFLVNKKYCFYFVVLICTPIVFIGNLRERFLNSVEHFFIIGGRSEIWEIGLELASKFPLGIGFGNSYFLRSYSNTIPPELVHFHNTYLNILVEGGVLSLLVFLWFFYTIFRLSLQNLKINSFLTLGAGSALFSWLIAGLFEYNFGDSEIMLIVYFVIGLILSKQKQIGT